MATITRILALAFFLTGCETTNINQQALQGYLNYQQREQHHRDRMIQGQRAPMRPVAPSTNPYNPMGNANPYNPMGGF